VPLVSTVIDNFGSQDTSILQPSKEKQEQKQLLGTYCLALPELVMEKQFPLGVVEIGLVHPYFKLTSLLVSDANCPFLSLLSW
jgi:hypothetical protein